MKNTKWNDYGIVAVRTGFMSINITEAVKRFVAYMRKVIALTICKQYDEAKTYHDGKWVMFEPTDTFQFSDYMKLLAIKRKPNRK